MSRKEALKKVPSRKDELLEAQKKLEREKLSIIEKLRDIEKELTIITKNEELKERKRLVKNIYNHVSVYMDDDASTCITVGSGLKRKREEEEDNQSSLMTIDVIHHDVLKHIFYLCDSIWDIVSFLRIDRKRVLLLRDTSFLAHVLNNMKNYELEFLHKTSVQYDLVGKTFSKCFNSKIVNDKPTVLNLMYLEILNTMLHRKHYLNKRGYYSSKISDDRYDKYSLLKNAYVIEKGNFIKVTEYIKNEANGFLVAKLNDNRRVTTKMEKKIDNDFLSSREFGPLDDLQSYHSSFIVNESDIILLDTFIDSNITHGYDISFIVMKNNYKPSLSSLKMIRLNKVIKADKFDYLWDDFQKDYKDNRFVSLLDKEYKNRTTPFKESLFAINHNEPLHNPYKMTHYQHYVERVYHQLTEQGKLGM